jgi:hypothetical protein
VAKKQRIDLPVGPLPDLIRWWKSQKVRGLVIGGLAVALLGRPRVTRDIDALLLLPESRWQGFVAAGDDFGFVPRIPDVLAFAREARVLLFRHEPSGIDVDIVLGSLPFEEEALARARTVRAGRVSIPVPSPEDLIIMKAIANRDRDLLDIDGLLAAHPKTDLNRIRHWVRVFADALESPEIYDNLAARLSRRPPRGRGKRK